MKSRIAKQNAQVRLVRIKQNDISAVRIGLTITVVCYLLQNIHFQWSQTV